MITADEPRREEATQEQRAFEDVYLAVRRFAAVVAPSDVEPDDLVQEAVARALARQPLDTFRALEPYLRTTVLNLVRGQIRHNLSGRQALLRTAEPDATTPAYPSDLAALEELTPDQRAVVYLVDIEGLPMRDAADILECSVSAAKKRASRARRILRGRSAP